MPVQPHPPSSPTTDFVESMLIEQLDGLESALRKHPRVVLGVGAVAVVGAGFLVYALRARRRREQRHEAILGLAARLLGTPAAEPAPRRGVVKESVKKAGGAFVTAAGRELGRRVLLAVLHPVALQAEEERAPA
jgi:hypothetical protein